MVASALLSSPVFVTGRRVTQQQQRPLVLARGCRPGYTNHGNMRGSPFFAFQQAWGGPQQSAQAWQELFRAAEKAFGSGMNSRSGSSSNGPNNDWGSWQRAAAHAWAFPVDIVESETEYVLTADVPGLAKGDLKIRVNEEKRTLTISGERRRPESQAKAADASSSSKDSSSTDASSSSSSSSSEPSAAFAGKRTFERRMGPFERTFTLSEKADPAAVSARVERGVLTLTILKKERDEPQVKDVPIWD